MSARPAPMLLAAIALVACSAPEEKVVTETTTVPAAFAKYCIGTLKVEFELMYRQAPHGWGGDGSRRAAVGSTFLLGLTSGDRVDLEGYAFDAKGTAHRLNDIATDLVIDKHFTTDCNLELALERLLRSDVLERRRKVLLAETTVYPSKDLTGTACKLPAGTEFFDLLFVAGGFTSSDLPGLCGFSTGYSADIPYAAAIPR